MAIEYDQHGPLGKLKGFIALNPERYIQLKLLRDQFLRALHRYPRTYEKRVRGIEYRMSVSTRQEDLVVNGAGFEAEQIEAMLDSIRLGDVIYDVGAATGTHAIPAALKTGSSGIVYAFEPDYECGEGLDRNIRLNNLPNIDVCREALWSKDEYLMLHSDGIGGDAPQVSLEGEPSTKFFLGRQRISGRSIRSLINNNGFQLPDILKIDVEGAGLHVLQGLGQFRPRDIFMEAHPTMGEDLAKITEFLTRRRYELVASTPRGQQEHLHFSRE